jgi:hypothetical protein
MLGKAVFAKYFNAPEATLFNAFKGRESPGCEYLSAVESGWETRDFLTGRKSTAGGQSMMFITMRQ